jgi:hypothetical protein
VTSRLGTGKSLTFFYSVVSIQLYMQLYQFIKLSAFGKLPRLHSFLQRFYNFCNSLAYLPSFLQLFCYLTMQIFTSPAIICPVFCVVCCLSTHFLQLSSYYLSSFLQLFAAYLYNFWNSPAIIYPAFCSCSAT